MIIKCTEELNTLVAKSSHTISSISNVHSITTKLVLHFSVHEIEASISNVHAPWKYNFSSNSFQTWNWSKGTKNCIWHFEELSLPYSSPHHKRKNPSISHRLSFSSITISINILHYIGSIPITKVLNIR